MEQLKRIDLAYLYNLTEGNTSQVIECINIFIETTAKEIKNMKTACEEKHWQEVRATAHKLKSSIKALFTFKFVAHLELIEEFASDERNTSLLPELISEFEKESLIAFKELEEERSKLEVN